MLLSSYGCRILLKGSCILCCLQVAVVVAFSTVENVSATVSISGSVMVDHVALVNDDKRLLLPLALKPGVRMDFVDIESEQLERRTVRTEHSDAVAVSASGLAQANLVCVATLSGVLLYRVPVDSEASGASAIAEPVYTASCGEGRNVTAVSVEDDAEYLYVGCSDGSVMVWSTDGWHCVGSVQMSDAAVSRIVLTQYDEMVVVVSADGTIDVCNQRQLLAACTAPATDQQASTGDRDVLSSHRSATAAVVVMSRGGDTSLLATVDVDGYMRLWNIESFAVVGQCVLASSVTNSELTLACGGHILIALSRTASADAWLMLCCVTSALELTCTTVEDIPGRIMAVAIGIRDTDMFVASKTGDVLAVYHVVLDGSSGGYRQEGVVTAKSSVVTDDVALKITADGRYAVLRLGCSEKEIEIIVKAEKKNNLFVSSGK